jgi:hypothetical protein
MNEIVNLKTLEWLLHTPASDTNFTNALAAANLPTVEEAIRRLPASAPKSKTFALARKLRQLKAQP